jgi:hypothetical protein
LRATKPAFKTTYPLQRFEKMTLKFQNVASKVAQPSSNLGWAKAQNPLNDEN